MFAKVKYLLALGLLFLIPACATGQATGSSAVDIDATVEARLAIIPTPTPQIVIQEVEVIVEKEIEVPIETEVIKEIIVEKEVIIEVPKEVIKEVEVVKEVTVEKIVEVVVTATPTPKPTATPTPLPIPTATPTPDASEYISMETSSGTTNNGFKYIDIVVKNTHPSLSIDYSPKLYVEEKDSDGYIVSPRKGNSLRWAGDSACLLPTKSYRFRYPDLNTPLITADFEPAIMFNSQPECGMEIENIDETLIDEVEIDFQRTSAYSFSVEIRNNSMHEIKWHGEFLVKDIYGNIIYHLRSSNPLTICHITCWQIEKILPNQKISTSVRWRGLDSMISCDNLTLCKYGIKVTDLENFDATLDGEYMPYSYYIEWGSLSYIKTLPINEWGTRISAYGNFTTDLEILDATLKTIVLSKVD